jgi:DNA-binding NarL/FixJ family response regulator
MIENAHMRELFDNNPKKLPPTTSRDYLKPEGSSIQVQVVVPDELEQLGIEHLLKSRGAKVLSFEGAELDDATSDVSLINPKADVIVLAAETSRDVRNELPRLIQLVADAAPSSKILAISSVRFESENSIALNTSTSADCATLKRTDRIDSEELLKSVLNLQMGINEELEALVSNEQHNRLIQTAERIPNLTSREREILGNVAKGFSNKQIASQLGLSLRTINNHVGMTFLKLGVNSDSEINGRVTATLAFCLYNRAIVKTPGASMLPESPEPVIVSSVFHFFAHNKSAAELA